MKVNVVAVNCSILTVIFFHGLKIDENSRIFTQHV